MLHRAQMFSTLTRLRTVQPGDDVRQRLPSFSSCIPLYHLDVLLSKSAPSPEKFGDFLVSFFCFERVQPCQSPQLRDGAVMHRATCTSSVLGVARTNAANLLVRIFCICETGFLLISERANSPAQSPARTRSKSSIGEHRLRPTKPKRMLTLPSVHTFGALLSEHKCALAAPFHLSCGAVQVAMVAEGWSHSCHLFFHRQRYK